MNQLDQRAMGLHVPVLGWLYLLMNLLLLLVGKAGLLFLGGIGVLSGDPDATRILVFIGLLGLLSFAVLAIPGLVAGVGLLRRRAWGRVLAIAVGFLGLAAFPIGTAIGIYALVVLLQQAASEYFIPRA